MTNPEKIVKATIAILLLFGFACMVFGYSFDHDLSAIIGRWVLLSAILLAFVPLFFFVIMLIAEKFRRK